MNMMLLNKWWIWWKHLQNEFKVRRKKSRMKWNKSNIKKTETNSTYEGLNQNINKYQQIQILKTVKLNEIMPFIGTKWLKYSSVSVVIFTQ